MALVGPVFFDTSVLVTGLASAGPASHDAKRLMVAVTQGQVPSPSTAWHCCLEFYAVITRLPPEFRVLPDRARHLLREQILTKLAIQDLPAERRGELVDSLERDAVFGGRTYDLYIAEIARSIGARTVVTGNRRHFAGLSRYGVRVMTPEEAAQEI